MITDPFAPGRPWLADQIQQAQPAQHPTLFPAADVLEPTPPAELTIRVLGEPVPQGSMQGFKRGSKIVLVPTNQAQLKPWRATVTTVARATAARERWTRLDGAVEVGIVFFLPRPDSAPRRRIWPEKKPDLDKLIRAVGDALTDAAVLHDDARIVHLETWKRYAAGDIPTGARIVVRNGVDAERPLRVLHPSLVSASADLSGGAS